MRCIAGFAFSALLFGLALVQSSKADILISVSLLQQQLAVTVDGVERYRWPVSTGRRGLETPTGQFRALWLEREWYSRQYDDTPMPWSIFFHKGFAVHGTSEARNLGRAVSHGCVRLGNANAATLFALASERGKGNVRVVVTDAPLPALPVPSPAAIAQAPAPQEMNPAAMVEIAVPLPPEFAPQFAAFATPEPAIAEAVKEIAAPAPVEIVVPLPDPIEPQFAELPKPDDKPAVADAEPVPVGVVEAVVLPPPPVVEAEAAEPQPATPPEPTPPQATPPQATPLQATPHQTEIQPATPQLSKPQTVKAHVPPRLVLSRTRERFTAVGDDAAVRRGREAWLRSLGRKYGAAR